jgi:transducin (beta)-like 1
MGLSTVITSEEVNYLIYRYLLEAGFVHSAFTFGQESFVSQSEVRPADVAPGLLISVLQKGLQYSALEHHINEDGSERKCGKPFNLLHVHVCEEEEKEIEGRTEEISESVDTPIQSSLSTLNLALQNASIMAANAVYGSSGPTAQTSTVSNTGKSTTVNSISAGSNGNKKKKQKEIKEPKEAMKESSTSASVADVEMKDSSVIEIKTEDSELSGQFAEEEIVELIGHHSEVIGCAWNPKKKNLLASASGDSTVRLWTFPASASSLYEINPRTVNKNARVLEHVLIKDNERSTDVTCLEWRRDGSALATGCYDGKARIWSSQGDLQRTLQKHTGPIFAVRWNLNGRFLLTSGIDGLTIIWDVEGGGVKNLLQNHTAACLDADWRNETEFATSGSDKCVYFYDMSLAPAEGTGETFNPSCTLTGHTDDVNTVKFDPSGKWLATCSDDSTVRLWSLEKEGESGWQGKCLKVLEAHSKQVYTLKWGPISGSGVFASASFDCSVRIWRISQDNDEVSSMELIRHTQPVYAIAFSPCGKYLASGSLDESLLIWDVQSGTVLKSYYCSGHGGIFDLEWRDNWVAAGNSQGRVIVLEFNTEEITAAVKEGEEGVKDDVNVEAVITEAVITEAVITDAVITEEVADATVTPAQTQAQAQVQERKQEQTEEKIQVEERANIVEDNNAMIE